MSLPGWERSENHNFVGPLEQSISCKFEGCGDRRGRGEAGVCEIAGMARVIRHPWRLERLKSAVMGSGEGGEQRRPEVREEGGHKLQKGEIAGGRYGDGGRGGREG